MKIKQLFFKKKINIKSIFQYIFIINIHKYNINIYIIIIR